MEKAMKMASRSIEKKNTTNCTYRRFFFLIEQENKFARVARFLSFFTVVLHNYNAVLWD